MSLMWVFLPDLTYSSSPRLNRAEGRTSDSHVHPGSGWTAWFSFFFMIITHQADWAEENTVPARKCENFKWNNTRVALMEKALAPICPSRQRRCVGEKGACKSCWILKYSTRQYIILIICAAQSMSFNFFNSIINRDLWATVKYVLTDQYMLSIW